MRDERRKLLPCGDTTEQVDEENRIWHPGTLSNTDTAPSLLLTVCALSSFRSFCAG